MRGFITECDFAEAEQAFPGIAALYRAMGVKPRTFLDLVRIYFCAHPGEVRDARTVAPAEAPR